MTDYLELNSNSATLGDATIPADWAEQLKKRPDIMRTFERGVMKPVLIDLLFADKDFTPSHRDDPTKDGRTYRVTRESLQRAVNAGTFENLPIILRKLDEATHGKHGDPDRKTIGMNYGAVIKEDDRGFYVQTLGGLFDDEIPEEYKTLQAEKGKIGASAEFGVLAIDEKGTISEIMPRNALLLDRNNAAFKETMLYCSDASEIKADVINASEPAVGGEPPAGTDKKEKNCDEPKTTKPKRGKNMAFCETCAPLVEQEKEKAARTARAELQAEIDRTNAIAAEKQTLELAASNAKAEADAKTVEYQKTIDGLNQKVADMEKANQDSAKTRAEELAASKAATEFEKRRGDYPEDKHPELQRLFTKVELGAASKEEILCLADWKTSKTVDKKGDPLTIAGGNVPPAEKPIYTDEQVDDLISRVCGPLKKEGK